jgi:hypothetical protein
VREDKVANAVRDTLNLLNKHKLTARELIVFCGNVVHSVGASISGIKDGNTPGIEELKKLYYSKPTLDVALMLQGLLILTWEKDFSEVSSLASLGTTEEDEST